MRFGWIEVISDAPRGKTPKTRGWHMEQAWRTPWGTAALWTVAKFVEADSEDDR